MKLEYSIIKLDKYTKILNYMLVFFKIIAIIFTIAWVGLIFVLNKNNDASNEYYKSLNKIFYHISDTLFWLIIVILIVSAIILLIIFNKSNLYLLKHILPKPVLKVFKLKFKTKYSIVPRSYVSLIWWIGIWIIFSSILASISKITHSDKWILFAY